MRVSWAVSEPVSQGPVRRQRDKEKSLRNVTAKSGQVGTGPRQGPASESWERRLHEVTGTGCDLRSHPGQPLPRLAATPRQRRRRRRKSLAGLQSRLPRPRVHGSPGLLGKGHLITHPDGLRGWLAFPATSRPHSGRQPHPMPSAAMQSTPGGERSRGFWALGKHSPSPVLPVPTCPRACDQTSTTCCHTNEDR